MTEKKTETQPIDKAQDPITLDLNTNTLTVNSVFSDKLKQAPDIIKRAQKLAKTKIDDIDEDEMTEINKDIRPLTDYEKIFASFKKYLRKQLKARDEDVLNQLDTIYNDAQINTVASLNKDLRQLQKDFKANRANKRWDELKTLFQAQLDTYPELTELAASTLGNFSYYRIHHNDMVSEAKTKPINNATIKQLNQDLFNYHEDLTRLTTSTITPGYYERIIEQYAPDPTTENMLAIIKTTAEQQLKDAQREKLNQIKLAARDEISKLWTTNDKIEMALDNKFKPNDQSELAAYESRRNDLIKAAESTIQNVILDTDTDLVNQYLDENGTLKQTTLNIQVKAACKAQLESIELSLSKHLSQPVQSTEPVTPKPAEKAPEDPYQWLLDYIQAENWQDAHENEKSKVAILRDLFANITNSSSVWRKHIKSNTDIITVTQYIANM